MAISATLFLLPIALLHGVVNGQTQPGASCGVIGAPVKCVPLSQNVLQLVRPPAMTAATSTCDNELFCGRVDPFGTTSDVVCSTCPVVDADAVFPVGFILEDLFDVQRVPLIERSRWQSGILPSQQSSVTITGNLVRTFTMASFAFDFYHTQPQSIFVERSINNGTTYTPYIYFAVDCEASFNILPEDSPQALRPSVENPDVAVCIPITNPGQGGGVFYNLREDRIPTSTTIPLNVQTEIQIDTDANLQAWLRATDFRITLTGVTYPTGIVGNSSFNFFSAYTLSIVGQCQCFGHSTGICEAGDVPCACEHRTTGFDCSICLPGFVDVPWRPSTLREPFECQACNCNQHADTETCIFDPVRFAQTGNMTGGVCQNCQDNTAGPQCDTCVALYYPQENVPLTASNICILCACNLGGVTDNGDCSKVAMGGFPVGQCNCKSNTMSRDCSQCTATSFNFQAANPLGCTDCECVAAGTEGGSLNCNSISGDCMCKPNVIGRRCDTCQPGFFNLDTNNPNGCTQCDCQFGTSIDITQCNNQTGQCLCYPGYTGLRCDILMPQYYVPDFENARAEGEDQSGIAVLLPVPPGSSPFQPTGRGFAVVPFNGNIGTISLTLNGALLPRRGNTFTIFMRYVLTGTPTIATAQISSHSFVDAVGLRTPGLEVGRMCSVASFGDIRIPSCNGQCPDQTFTIEFTVNLAPTTPVYVDSVVFRPDITLLTTSPGSAEFLMNYSSNACAASNVAPAACELMDQVGTCKNLQMQANSELYEGPRMCDCTVYATSQDCSDCGGACTCLPNVVGRTCDRCQAGTFNLTSTGCTPCECDADGSTSLVCDFTSGMCVCRAGRTGRRCDVCLPNHYPIANGTCQPCGCDPVGSTSQQCNMTGFCSCIQTVTGRTCDMCNCETLNTINSNMSCNAPDGQCFCGVGSTGLKCENCVSNFFFATGMGCQACTCNGHAQTCNMSGCIMCQDNTIGQMCEQCISGYYGDATGGTPNDCQECMCNGWATTCDANPLATNNFRCNDCTGNTEGDQCERCRINHFGMPTMGTACQSCLPRCNGNIDVNVAGSCNMETGDCLMCTRNTVGSRCELCAPGFFGDATVANGCQPCQCDMVGSSSLTCNRMTGVCECHPNVVGDQCDQCAPDHFGFASGQSGCEPCACDTTGSINSTCDVIGGNCRCQMNIGGRQCDRCFPDHFNFSPTGCTPCDCEVAGTINQNTTCELVGGMCQCEPLTINRRCDACEGGNFFVPNVGCSQCPCNGRSNECTVDGICLNCMGNSEGNNCEDCIDGFYNDTTTGAPYGTCVPCACNEFGSSNSVCMKQGGQCPCRPGVEPTSRTCDVCQDQFFGLSATGCDACNCNIMGRVDNICNKDNGTCACRTGFMNRQCDACLPGFYDFANGCLPCGCNETGSVSQVCNVNNGMCTCRSNIVGRTCDQCATNTYGFSSSGCQQCNCNAIGSTSLQCDLITGDCPCQPGVGNDMPAVREQCTQCQDQFFNFSSTGCQDCNCNVDNNASLSNVCNKLGGQCDCHVNIVGRTCDRCIDDHVVFRNGSGCFECPCDMRGTVASQCNRTNGVCPVMCFCLPNVDGCFCDRCDPRSNVGGFPTCAACNCSEFGSVNGTCDESGQCLCREGSLGFKCENCAENFFLTAAGCRECPECYREVRDKVVAVRMRVEVLRMLIDQLLNSTLLTSEPPVVERIATLLRQACQLLNDTLVANVTDTRIAQDIDELRIAEVDLTSLVNNLVQRARPVVIAAGAASAQVFSAETQINDTVRTVNLAYNSTVLTIGPAISEALALLDIIMDLRATLTMDLTVVATAARNLRTQALQLQTNAAEASRLVGIALTEATSALDTARQTANSTRMLMDNIQNFPNYLAIAVNAQQVAYAASARAQDQLTRAQQIMLSLPLVDDNGAIVNQAQFALDLMNRSVALDETIQSNFVQVLAYYEQVANLSQDVSSVLPAASSLREQATAAYQQARAYADRVTMIISRATLASEVLANFSAETEEARRIVNASLAQSADLRSRGAATQQRAESLTASHTAALNNARTALINTQLTFEVARQVAAVAQQALTFVDDSLNASRTGLATLEVTLNETIQTKLQGSIASQATCMTSQSRVNVLAANVTSTEEELQRTVTTANTAISRVQTVYQDLMAVNDAPLARLVELRSEFLILQNQLSDAQVDNVVTRLQGLLASEQGRLNTYRTTLDDLAMRVTGIQTMRDTLRRTCPVA